MQRLRDVQNLYENTLQIRCNAVIGKTQDLQAASSYGIVTLAVVIRLLIMDCAVRFDNQTNGMAVKIHNEAVNRLLAPKMQSAQLVAT